MKKLLALGTFLIFLDLFTKWIFSIYQFGEGYFKITYAENMGAAFSILQNQQFLFIVVAIAVIFIILFYYNKFEYKLPLVLILAGTIGNMIDRIAFGFVRDFISIFNWPIFNLADVFNMVGVILLILYWIKEDNLHTKLFKALGIKNK